MQKQEESPPDSEAGFQSIGQGVLVLGKVNSVQEMPHGAVYSLAIMPAMSFLSY